MVRYRELYLKLFSAAADAVEAIDEMNFGKARAILLRAQLEAEEAHMEEPTGVICDFLERL